MASEESIANAAAIRVGTSGRITSLNDDRTVARTLKGVWAVARQAVLRDGAFNFATRSTDLAAQGSDQLVPYPWTYAYEEPADCLRLLKVKNVAARRDYELQGRQILCNAAGPLYIDYVVDVPELALWDAAAADAFAINLACRVGRKLAGSAFDLEACKREYRDAIGRVKFVDATENPPIRMEEGSWAEARYSGNWMID